MSVITWRRLPASAPSNRPWPDRSTGSGGGAPRRRTLWQKRESEGLGRQGLCGGLPTSCSPTRPWYVPIAAAANCRDLSRKQHKRIVLALEPEVLRPRCWPRRAPSARSRGGPAPCLCQLPEATAFWTHSTLKASRLSLMRTLMMTHWAQSVIQGSLPTSRPFVTPARPPLPSEVT